MSIGAVNGLSGLGAAIRDFWRGKASPAACAGRFAGSELRARQRRNLLPTLLPSQGVPMITGDDEIARTQAGNNNGWCQDNSPRGRHRLRCRRCRLAAPRRRGDDR